jgi:putative salt-induced outer membrane protein YdiY
MTSAAVLLATFLAGQAEAQLSPPPGDVARDAARAAAAAEKAAAAALVAAEAALKVAEAAARVAVVPAKLELPAAVAPPVAAKLPSPWSGTVGLGLISLTGNSKTVTFSANAAAERKSAGWIMGAKLHASYGQNRLAGATESQTVAESGGVQLRLDRRFGERYSTYVLAAADTDHVKSVEVRSTGEVGATVVWVDAAGEAGWKTTLRTDFGFRVANEQRYQYYLTEAQLAAVGGLRSLPADTLYAPRAAVALKYALSKDVLFSEDVEILPNVVGESRVVANSISKVSTRLSRTLAFGVAFTVNHDSRPAATKVATDTALALTLDVLL